MIITVKRKGGFAGFDDTLGRIDTAELPQEQAAALERALQKMPAPPADVGADFLHYEITIQDRGTTRVLIVADEAKPGSPLATVLALL